MVFIEEINDTKVCNNLLIYKMGDNNNNIRIKKKIMGVRVLFYCIL